MKLIRFSKEVGISNSRNYGVNIAKGEYLAFIDDDAIADKNWLEEIQEGIKTGADILGGPLKPIFEVPPPKWWNEKDFGGVAAVDN
jgi:glycosyltransferase involved in cell wall biosynthesis